LEPQSLPCETVVEDCKDDWSCEPACKFALYTSPKKCANPYNPDLFCGMGLGQAASFQPQGMVSDLPGEGSLHGETGTCLEMVEVSSDTASKGSTILL
jgi:hypothetical protein